MAKSELRIETLGTSFSITADEDADYLKGLLNVYRGAVETTQKNTGLRDPLKIAILTGFLFCDELRKLQSKTSAEEGSRSHESREAQELTLNMIARIDEVLEYGG
jgi:cell division protein ZapA (FtsZ GTPase activity inhibitor)